MPLEAQGFELATQSIKRKENKDFQHIQRALTFGKEPAAFSFSPDWQQLPNKLQSGGFRARIWSQILGYLWFSDSIEMRGRAMLPIVYSQVLSALLMCKIYVGCRVESPFWIQTNSISNILPTKQASLVLFFFLLKDWLNALPRCGKKHYLEIC